MIEITEQFAVLPDKLWPLISDPRRWPDWIAGDGPWLPPESVMPIAADGSEWLAAAADGQQATWQVVKSDDDYRLQCMTTDTKHAAMPMRLLHHLQISPIENGCLLEWATEYDLARVSFWQKIVMHGPVRNAIETMQIYSLINLHDITTAPTDDEEEQPEPEQ